MMAIIHNILILKYRVLNNELINWFSKAEYILHEDPHFVQCPGELLDYVIGNWAKFRVD